MGIVSTKFRRAKNYLRINKIRTKHILDTVTVSEVIGRLGDTLLILDFQYLQMTFVLQSLTLMNFGQSKMNADIGDGIFR